MLNQILYQVWINLTLSSAIAGLLLGIIIFQHNDKEINDFKKAVAFAFFGVTIEIVSRFIAIIIHSTLIPTSELIICSVGRFIESTGLWGLIFYILKLWPFRNK